MQRRPALPSASPCWAATAPPSLWPGRVPNTAAAPRSTLTTSTSATPTLWCGRRSTSRPSPRGPAPWVTSLTHTIKQKKLRCEFVLIESSLRIFRLRIWPREPSTSSRSRPVTWPVSACPQLPAPPWNVKLGPWTSRVGEPSLYYTRITSYINVTEVFRGITDKHEKYWRSFDAECWTMTPGQMSFLCARVFITSSFGRTFRSGLRPELQWGQRSLPGRAVEGSSLHRSERRHWIFCWDGQEGLIRVCYPEWRSREPPLPAGEREDT